MSQQRINIGSGQNEGDGGPVRLAFEKINSNFDELYQGTVQTLTLVGTTLSISGGNQVTFDDVFEGGLTADLTGSVFGDDSTLLVDGVNSKINLQNTVLNDTISTSDENFFINTAATPGDRGFTNITTTDNILDIQGAAALPGGQGGGIYINGGIPFDDPDDYTRYGDIIISGRIVSILAGDGEGGGGVTFGGPVIGTTTMDIKGSVFGDDSTLLVDGVNGKLVGDYENGTSTIGSTRVESYDIKALQDLNTLDSYVNGTLWGGATSNIKNLVIGSTAPSTSNGASGDRSGMIAFDSTYIYYCTANYTDGVADIWKRVAWSADTW